MTAPAPSHVPQVGTTAPDFTLPSTSGADVTLSQFRGTHPVLLAFFPLAFTSTCTAEMCAFRDEYDAFADRGVVVLPISVDSIPTLKEYKARYSLRTDFLSDFKRAVGTLYDVMWPEAFFTNRAYFLIDRDGVIRWVRVEPNPGSRRENAEILAEIAKL